MRNINYKFALLKIVGIMLVVMGHIEGGGGITVFTDWFPPYSFHLPLFIFISGYFYKNINSKNFFEYINVKFKKLIIPYFIWNLIYGIILTILLSRKIVYFGSKINLRTYFIEPWINSHQFVFNLASWFVLTLFLVQVVYAMLRIFFRKIRLNNEYIIMILYIILGGFTVFLANNDYNKGLILTIDRVMFLIQFFHLGYLYKIKLEEKDKLNSLIYLLIIFIIQFILISKYENINFIIAWCNNFNRDNIFLPFIVAITGIAFWLRLCDILSKIFINNKVVEYISNNTWTIMMHHMFVIFIINTFISKLGLSDFNFEAYRTNIFYIYQYKDYRFNIFYLILSFSIPLIVKFYMNKLFINKKN